LKLRRAEIEATTWTRAFAVSDPGAAAGPEYVEGLRAAIAAAVDYAIAAVELGEERAPPVPAGLLVQARVAARTGISLDTVLRRCFAGFTLFGDFVIEEGEAGGLRGKALQQVLRTQAVIFDRLIASVSEEYGVEAQGHPLTTGQRRVRQVEGLLAGELLNASELAYDFDAWHIGLVGVGPGAKGHLGELAGELDRQLLVAEREEGTTWAWLGGRSRMNAGEVERHARSASVELCIGVGEAAHGLIGWRLTHRQARAVLPIAVRRSKGLVRYSEAALLASMLQDDLLRTSLRELYLMPLSDGPGDGAVLRQTLRAYFAADRNASSAAAALGVTRHTVANRLRTIEERLERPLTQCAAEVTAALQLEDLGYQSSSHFTLKD
jgi:hypothetical protein